MSQQQPVFANKGPIVPTTLSRILPTHIVKLELRQLDNQIQHVNTSGANVKFTVRDGKVWAQVGQMSFKPLQSGCFGEMVMHVRKLNKKARIAQQLAEAEEKKKENNKKGKNGKNR